LEYGDIVLFYTVKLFYQTRSNACSIFLISINLFSKQYMLVYQLNGGAIDISRNIVMRAQFGLDWPFFAYFLSSRCSFFRAWSLVRPIAFRLGGMIVQQLFEKIWIGTHNNSPKLYKLCFKLNNNLRGYHSNCNA